MKDEACPQKKDFSRFCCVSKLVGCHVLFEINFGASEVILSFGGAFEAYFWR